MRRLLIGLVLAGVVALPVNACVLKNYGDSSPAQLIAFADCIATDIVSKKRNFNERVAVTMREDAKHAIFLSKFIPMLRAALTAKGVPVSRVGQAQLVLTMSPVAPLKGPGYGASVLSVEGVSFDRNFYGNNFSLEVE